jgi:diguanylate cyclase (GGDEF)-like protein/PAS domain S-box-containing protein
MERSHREPIGLRRFPPLAVALSSIATLLAGAAAGRRIGLHGGELVALAVVALAAVLAPIGARRIAAAEAALELSEAALAQAQAIGGVGSWEWDPDAGPVRWSHQQLLLHGLEPDAGAPSLDDYLALVHPGDREVLAATLAAHCAAGEELASEHRIIHPTLGTRTLQLRGGVAQGRRLAGTTRDVTAERAAEASLANADERFRRSFEDARIGMMIIALDATYERVNDAFCAIVGYGRDQLEGTSRERITHPDDIAADAAALRSLLDGEARSHSREKRYLHATGHAVWAAINVTLIRGADGEALHFIAQVQDITARRANERQLQHMADHDPLTGLLNRRSFERELSSHMARAERYGPAGAMLMLDLDNFKYFNDTRGHTEGDKLIVRIAQSLRSRLRASDVLARLGGDEFAVLLPAEDEAETQLVADTLLQVVRDESMAPLSGELRRVSASIGIARFDDQPRLTAEEMMVNADLAMYDAKEAGRDRCARYRTEQHSRPKIESRMKWVAQINAAIASDGFELLAQPIVPLTSNGPTQYELLLRMRNAHGDLVPPGAFLYVAERLGLILAIDRWVANRAIDMLAEQGAAGHDLRFEVNLSGLTIGDDELLQLVERRLSETGVPPDRLIFEVTETAAVANIGRAAGFAEHLSALGCSFALDDFGAGFGSFYYLKHLPFDYLKIDGEFVRHCAANPTDRTLIAAVVQIAKGMGKRTIAEFVCDEETTEVVRRLGVDYGQGFYLGRPAPLEEHLARVRPTLGDAARSGSPARGSLR